MLKKPVAVFFLSFAVIACALVFFRIRMFDAEVVLNYGGVRHTEPVKTSLKEIFRIGVTNEELQNVESFHLNATGYALAFLVIIGLPVLIAFRVKLTQDNRKRQEEEQAGN